MSHPDRTPLSVRRAIAVYRGRRRLVGVVAALAVGVSLAGLVILATLLLDRFVETGPWLRLCGDGLALACLAGGLVAALRVLLHRESERRIAIRLDQALPGNADRWATSYDLAGRQARGEAVGATAAVERLYAETEAHTVPASAAALVSTRGLRLGLLGLLLAVLGLAGFEAAARAHWVAANPALLRLRLLHPYGNFPRDSRMSVTLDPAPDVAWRLDGAPVGLAELPEGETFTLRLRRALPTWALAATLAGPADSSADAGTASPVEAALPSPRIEWLQADGTVTPLECLAVGDAFVFTRPEMTQPFRFRVRCADALTAVYEVDVRSRIKIRELRHSVRFPTYAKLTDIKDEPLTAERLALLEESRLEFTVECDQQIASLDATFELLADAAQASAAAGGGKSLQERLAIERGRATGATPVEPTEKQRTLRVKIRRDQTATFQMKVDQPGILRIRVTGENGLTGRERVCIIEPRRDSPPRISVSGLEADSYIVPGELIDFQYTAEDDLAVSDIIMDWNVAGAARSDDLAGEDYLRNDALGTPVVQGGESIQRMNYRVYGTSPFEFALIVVDSKGQESRSGTYRVNLMTDSHATRFAAAMEYFGILRMGVAQHVSRMRELQNLLKIVAATVGDSKTWPGETVDKALDNYTETAAKPNGIYEAQRTRPGFAGWPLRVQESFALILALYDAENPEQVFGERGAALRRSTDVSADIARLQADLTVEMNRSEALYKVIETERRRFDPEAVFQGIRNIRQRLGQASARSNAKGGDAKDAKGAAGAGAKANFGMNALFVSNLPFYRGEAKRLTTAVAALSPELSATLKPLFDDLNAALLTGDPDALEAPLSAIEARLGGLTLPPGDALGKVADAYIADAANDPAFAVRLRRAMGDFVVSRDAEFSAPPTEDLNLLHASRPDQPLVAGWYRAPASPLDFWLLGHDLAHDWEIWRLDERMQRLAMNPAEADDRKAGLREQAFTLLERLDRSPGIDTALATQARAALSPLLVGDVSAEKLADWQAVVERFGVAAQPVVAHPETTLDRALVDLQDAARRSSAEYRAFADDFDKAFAVASENNGEGVDWIYWRQRSSDLQTTPRLITVAYRKWLYARVATSMGRTPADLDWERIWLPRHGAQLQVLLNGEASFDSVTHRFAQRDWKRYGAASSSARSLADALDLAAATIAQVASPTVANPPTIDYAVLQKENKVSGYLDSLRAELTLITPFLHPADPAAAASARAQTFSQLAGSALGRVAFAEQDIDRANAIRSELAARATPPPRALVPLLQTLQRALAGPDGTEDDTGLADLAPFITDLATLPAAAQDAPLAPAMKLRLDGLRKALGEELSGRYGGLQLSPISQNRRGNVRATSALMQENWSIGGLVESFDRRWAYRQRDAELDLLRSLVEPGDPAVAPDDGARQRRRFALATIIEHRARQVAHDHRRNSGISYLDADAGPTLNLPPHIAKEFMRARNQRPPVLFKEPAEAYFQSLFKDASK